MGAHWECFWINSVVISGSHCKRVWRNDVSSSANSALNDSLLHVKLQGIYKIRNPCKIARVSYFVYFTWL